MRVLVHRCGSGWGGAHGYYLYDSKSKKSINLDKAFSVTKDKKFLSAEVLRFKMSDFPKESIREFPHNISLLNFLSSCDLYYSGITMMDQQIDYVYVLDEENNIRCVLDTNRQYWPANDALCAKLHKLLDYGW